MKKAPDNRPGQSLDDALAFASAGLRVFPVHGISQGKCTCGAKACENPGKHPITKKGFKDATVNTEQIRQWWSDHPGANIGLPTGAESDLFVLDVDPGKGGEESLAQLVETHGALPDSLQVKTGSGGRHFYFRYPDGGISNSASKIGPGLDIRGEGGYVVAPPSRHASGGQYLWANSSGFSPDAVLEAPNWLLDLIHKKPAAKLDTSDSISEGGRNADLTSFAGTMRRSGMQENEILAALLELNSSRCDPPLAESEVRQIAKSVVRYAPNTDTARTDLGNAQRLVIRHGDDLCYCYAWKCWMAWSGGRWVRDETGEIERRAKETVRAIRDEAALISDQEEAKKHLKWEHQSEHRARIKALIELGQSELPVTPGDFDKDPWLLNLENGTLDLRTGTLRRHMRQDLLSKMANVSFDPDAQCPAWLAFLDRIFESDMELIRYVQALLGYGLTGETGEQSFHVLYGKGANGKSTFIETVLRLVGDYGQKAEFSTLLARTSDTVRNDIAALRGTRLVAATEAERGRRLNEPLVKELTGGDTIRARFLFQEFFDFRPQFKLLLATNYKPEIRGIDEGIWRRVHLIPFAVTIPLDERDKHLVEKLDKERAGILNWALDGLRRWREEGLRVPEAVMAATEDYREEMDIIGEFMEARLEKSETGQLSAGDLWSAYQTWCESNGEKPVTQRTLGGLMRERGYQSDVKRVREKSTRVYAGLSLRSERF